MCVSHSSKVKYATKKTELDGPKIMWYGWIDGVKLKMTYYVLLLNFSDEELGKVMRNLYRLQDLLELNGEDLNWDVTQKWVIVQELH